MAKMSPRHVNMVIRLEPPWLMNGRGMPVRGTVFVTPPMLRKVWRAMVVVNPMTKRAPNGSLVNFATR